MTQPTPTAISANTDAHDAALAKFDTLRAALGSAFVGRGSEVDAILIALLAREHCLLLGPPGTGKSALTQAIAEALPGRYFQRLLTRFSTPEELFGPLSIAGLKSDRFERVTAGYLPEATTAFLDEIFKANSAILNALLTALNERAYDQGSKRIKIPLEVVIGASNELPESDEALGALYDRFMLRRWVGYLPSRDARKALLSMTGAPSVSVRLTQEELDLAREATANVHVPDDVIETILDVRDALAREVGIVMSDRRLRKILVLVKAHAALNGREVASKADVMVIGDSAWQTPDQRSAVVGAVASVACPDRAEALAILDGVTERMASLDLDNITTEEVGVMARVNKELKDAVAALGKLDDVDDITETVKAMQRDVARSLSGHLGIGI